MSAPVKILIEFFPEEFWLRRPKFATAAGMKRRTVTVTYWNKIGANFWRHIKKILAFFTLVYWKKNTGNHFFRHYTCKISAPSSRKPLVFQVEISQVCLEKIKEKKVQRCCYIFRRWGADASAMKMGGRNLLQVQNLILGFDGCDTTSSSGDGLNWEATKNKINSKVWDFLSFSFPMQN